MTTPQGSEKIENIVITATAPGFAPPALGNVRVQVIDGMLNIVIDRGVETVLPAGTDPGRIGGKSDSATELGSSVLIRPTEGGSRAAEGLTRSFDRVEAVPPGVSLKLAAMIAGGLAMQEVPSGELWRPSDVAARAATQKILSVASSTELQRFKTAYFKMETAANDPWYTARGVDPKEVRTEGAKEMLELLLQWLNRIAKLSGAWGWLVRMFGQWILPSMFGPGALVVTPAGDFVWLPQTNPTWTAVPGAFVRTRFEQDWLNIEIRPQVKPLRRLRPGVRVSPRGAEELAQLGTRLKPLFRGIEEELGDALEEAYRRQGFDGLPDYDLVFGVEAIAGPGLRISLQARVAPQALPRSGLAGNTLGRSEEKRRSMQAYIAGLALVNRTWGKLSELGDFAAVVLHSFQYANGTAVKRWDQLFRDWDLVTFNQRDFVIGLAYEQIGDQFAGVMGQAEKAEYLKAYRRGSDLSDAYGTWSTRYRRFSSTR